jgi:hypothetical protein
MWPVMAKNIATVRINLTLENGFKTAALKTKIKTANTGKE